MHFIHPIKKKITTAVALLLTASSIMAQSTPSATPAAQGSNLLATLLVIASIVLAFVIWGMGQALVAISRQVMLKNKNADKMLAAVMLLGLSILSQTGFAQATTTASDATQATTNYGGLTANNFYAFAGVIAIEIFAILFLTFSIRRIYQELLPSKVPGETDPSKLGQWWSSLDKKFFTKAVSVEREADVLLDHDYDGIHELNNALPPWWKWGFIFTIVVAFVYLLNFHVLGSGKNPTEEYATEMENARIQKELYDANNKDKVDEKNVPMADAAGIKSAKVLFESNCVACHLIDGGGNVGPNLTDDYWIHKGSLNDIFQTIKNGYPDKGMQSWSSKFSPKEISQIASYVKSLRGTKPATPKAPQGDLYVEEQKTDSLPPAPAAIKIDSAAAKVVK